MPGPALCDINDCGVLAVGRCSTCGKAMCDSHRHTNGWTPSTTCVECYISPAQQIADEKARATAWRDSWVPRLRAELDLRIQDGTMPAPMPLSRKQKKFGSGYKDVPVGTGWLVTSAQFITNGPMTRDGIVLVRTWPTPLPVDPQTKLPLIAGTGSWYDLTTVHPPQGGLRNQELAFLIELVTGDPRAREHALYHHE